MKTATSTYTGWTKPHGLATQREPSSESCKKEKRPFFPDDFGLKLRSVLSHSETIFAKKKVYLCRNKRLSILS